MLNRALRSSLALASVLAFAAPSAAQFSSPPISTTAQGIATQANSAFRDLEINGNAASGAHNPSKTDIRNLWVAQDQINIDRGSNVREYGGIGDGSTDNATPFQSLVTSVATVGGSIFLPCGKYRLTAAVTATIASGKSLTIEGPSAECATIYFPTGGGFNFTYGSPFSSLHIRNVSITTGGNGTGNAAISASYLSAYGNPALTTPNDFTNVIIRGDDAFNGANYWANGYIITQVSNVNWNGGGVYGSSGALGNGVFVQGSAARTSYGIGYNFFGGMGFINTGIGIIYGSYVQGMFIDTVNISNGITGIASAASETGVLDGLNITNLQVGVTGRSIDLQTAIGRFTLSNSIFQIYASQCGINLPGMGNASIVGVKLQGFTGLSTSGNTGICLSGSGGVNIVDSSTLSSLQTGISIGAGNNGNHIGNTNVFIGTGTPVTDAAIGTQNGYQGFYLGNLPFAINSGGFNILSTGDGVNQSLLLSTASTFVRGPLVSFQSFGGAATYGDIGPNGLRLTVLTVATLPTCNTAAKGTHSAVSDATAPTYNGTLTGGGAVSIPVYCNGTAWTAH